MFLQISATLYQVGTKTGYAILIIRSNSDGLMEKLKFLFCVILCIFVSLTNAQADRRTLSIAVGWDKPPYVMSDAQSGYEIEVISDVLTILGYEPKFIPIPYGRSYDILFNPRFDAVTTLSHKVKIEGVYLSSVYIEYQNVAISRRALNANIDKISDLAKYSLVAFQNAHRVLGFEFGEMTLSHKQYLEVPDQARQVRLLLTGKMQVIVMDINIFRYLHNQIIPQAEQQAVTIHPVFPINGYRMGFSNEALNDEFNEVFATYRKTKQFLRLQQKYNLHDQLGAAQISKD